MAAARTLIEHHQRAARRAAPAFLRRGDQHVDAAGLHVDPHRPRGDAIEDEQSAAGAHGVADGAQVRVRENDSRRGLDVRREYHVRLRLADRGDRFVDRDGRERRVPRGARPARLQHGRFRGNRPGVEDLRPAIAEPAVAQNQALPARGELPRHRFHPVRAAAGDDDGGMRVVDVLQDAREIAHDALKALRHVVERAVGEDHRIFEKAVGIDVG